MTKGGILDSIELFNLHTHQLSSFGTLNNPVGMHVGGFLNGTPFYCGGDSSLTTPEGSCYKFYQSWKKVIIIFYFICVFSTVECVKNKINRHEIKILQEIKGLIIEDYFFNNLFENT